MRTCPECGSNDVWAVGGIHLYECKGCQHYYDDAIQEKEDEIEFRRMSKKFGEINKREEDYQAGVAHDRDVDAYRERANERNL